MGAPEKVIPNSSRVRTNCDIDVHTFEEVLLYLY